MQRGTEPPSLKTFKKKKYFSNILSKNLCSAYYSLPSVTID